MHSTFASEDILDLVTTDNSSMLVDDLTVESVITSSDYNSIFFKLKLAMHKQVTRKITFQNVSNIDYKEFNSVICSVQRRNKTKECAHEPHS